MIFGWRMTNVQTWIVRSEENIHAPIQRVQSLDLVYGESKFLKNSFIAVCSQVEAEQFLFPTFFRAIIGNATKMAASRLYISYIFVNIPRYGIYIRYLKKKKRWKQHLHQHPPCTLPKKGTEIKKYNSFYKNKWETDFRDVPITETDKTMGTIAICSQISNTIEWRSDKSR